MTFVNEQYNQYCKNIQINVNVLKEIDCKLYKYLLIKQMNIQLKFKFK